MRHIEELFSTYQEYVPDEQTLSSIHMSEREYRTSMRQSTLGRILGKFRSYDKEQIVYWIVFGELNRIDRPECIHVRKVYDGLEVMMQDMMRGDADISIYSISGGKGGNVIIRDADKFSGVYEIYRVDKKGNYFVRNMMMKYADESIHVRDAAIVDALTWQKVQYRRHARLEEVLN